MSELVAIGGIQPLMKMLLGCRPLHGDCLTVTGATLAQNLAGVAPYDAEQQIVHSLANPIKRTVIWSCSTGTCAGGAVAKITGKEA